MSNPSQNPSISDNSSEEKSGIDRRRFISQVSLATGGLMLGFAGNNLALANNSFSASPSSSNFNYGKLRWEVRKDGSFDLIGDAITLKNCYPSFNGQPIHPLGVEVLNKAEEIEVNYKLAEGTVKLTLKHNDKGCSISSSLIGMAKAPHWVYPLANAEVIGIEKFFKQGLGFAGPSGFVNLTQKPYSVPKKTEEGSAPNWLLESYIVSGLLSSEGKTLGVTAYDHNNFLQKSALYNQQSRWGLINRHLLVDKVLFQSGFSTEEIPLKNNTLVLPELFFTSGETPMETMQEVAKNIASTMKARNSQSPRYHWCSWYYKEAEYTREDLNKHLSNLKKLKPSAPLQTVQIDDGYCLQGDWLESNERWPGGLKPAFDAIKKNKYNAGVWIGPFRVEKTSNLYKQHPDWVLKDLQGKVVEEGGMYILDSSHPDAFAYIRKVFRTFKQSGVSLYKTDFMDWGLQDSTRVRRHTPGKTSVQYFREFLSMIRQEIGEESYWLACISPFAPFIGYADGMRLANDSSKVWRDGTQGNMLNEVYSGQYFNNIFWQNDPDVVYLNNKANKLSHPEFLTMSYYAGIMGGSVNTSDLLEDEESVKLWRFILPTDSASNAQLPFWGKDKNLIIAVRPYKEQNGWAILAVNPSNTQSNEKFELAELIGEKEAFAFKWDHKGSSPISKLSALNFNLGSHESSLIFISKENKGPAANMTLGGRFL